MGSITGTGELFRPVRDEMVLRTCDFYPDFVPTAQSLHTDIYIKTKFKQTIKFMIIIFPNCNLIMGDSFSLVIYFIVWFRFFKMIDHNCTRQSYSCLLFYIISGTMLNRLIVTHLR